MRKVRDFRGNTLLPNFELKEYTISPFELLVLLQLRKYSKIIDNGVNFYGIFSKSVNKKTNKAKYYITTGYVTFEEALNDLKDRKVDLSKYKTKGYDLSKIEHVVEITKNEKFSLRYCKINNNGVLFPLINYLGMSPKTERLALYASLVFARKVKPISILKMIESEITQTKLYHPYIHCKETIDRNDPRIVNMQKYAKKSLSEISEEIDIRQLIGGDDMVQAWLNNYKIKENKVKK
jgi:hypothetical protein